MHFCAGVFLSYLDADLTAAGWDGVDSPYPGITKRQFLLQHMHKAVLKKYVDNVQGTTKAGDEAALAKFLDANDRCAAWRPSHETCNSAQAEIIGEVKAILWDFFNPNGLPLFTLGGIAQGFNCGPGSSVGVKGQDFYSKFCSNPLTTTSMALYDMYCAATGSHHLWNAQELRRSQVYGTKMVQGSQLSFVPKYAHISRVICTEPSLNMMYQKGMEKLMLVRLRQVFGIDLTQQQTINRRLARIAARWGRFATLDLESASDLISLLMCQEIIPPEALRWFLKVRSGTTTVPGSGELRLQMISSMGNATTFPLQTAIFAAVVSAVYRVMGFRLKKRDSAKRRFTPGYKYIRDYRRSLPNFAVNGDDIICRAETYRHVVWCLEWLGFRVNETKSFFTGDFRESCGADFFGSTNVRGVYIKRLLDVCDAASAINRLNRWSASHNVPLPRSVSYLRHLGKIPFVPADVSDSAGIKIPLSVARPRRDRNGSYHYRYLHIKVRAARLDQSTAEIRRFLPRYIINEAGLYNTLLASGIRDSQILMRSKNRKLSVKRGVSPCWDYHLAGEPGKASHWNASSSTRERWNALAVLNTGLQV